MIDNGGIIHLYNFLIIRLIESRSFLTAWIEFIPSWV
jgi:hypothetical protein